MARQRVSIRIADALDFDRNKRFLLQIETARKTYELCFAHDLRQFWRVNGRAFDPGLIPSWVTGRLASMAGEHIGDIRSFLQDERGPAVDAWWRLRGAINFDGVIDV